MKIIIAILIFSVLILFHELGHFLLAKACGVGVTEFALGMGPKLVSWGKGETKYAIKALPFGGSCALVGEDEDDPAPNAFGNKKAWQRFLVIVAGPAFNFLLAFICSLFFIGFGGVNKPVIYSVGEAVRPISGKAILSVQSTERRSRWGGRSRFICSTIPWTVRLRSLWSAAANC